MRAWLRAFLAGLMKKTPKPFALEVKRSRLPTRRQSTFQRYALPALTESKQEPMLSQGQTPLRNPAPPPPSQPRVLPDLSAGKVWIEEPHAGHTVASELVTVCNAPEEQAVVTPAALHAKEISPDVDLGTFSPEGPLLSPKPRKRVKGTAADLPRGQRWKRRLAQTAW